MTYNTSPLLFGYFIQMSSHSLITYIALSLLKGLFLLLLVFGVGSSLLYFFTTPKQNSNWVSEHAVLSNIIFDKNTISVKNIRDFKWGSAEKERHINMQFQLENIVKLKAVVSHFSAISEIAHVFIIFGLDDGRELGVSIEARREQGENFSIQGGLLAQFEIITVLATPSDLLGIRKINNEAIHIYPIKATPEKIQELFMLIANEVNQLSNNPSLYHLFFKNCTNQLVKQVSVLTDRKYSWFFQTLAPGNTGEVLYDLDLIDMPNLSFEQVQKETLVK